MKKIPYKQIKQALSNLEPENETQPKAPMSNADDFREDFMARARLIVQDTQTAPHKKPVNTWFLASACAAAFFIVAGVRMINSDSTSAYTVIKSLEIVASHSAVLIMEDETKDSTVLWIVDMNTNASNGENI
ncbi:MAG: hypothetical protein KAH23_01950 [Kiritimatiellae bacterium]|nr:hypothetical protein [Kiritimatiellia bacterium]